MLTSIAMILLLGLLTGTIFSKLRLPSLLGMIIVGIVLSPHALNLIDPSLLYISADLRQVALIIILTRAGLSLNLTDLKKIGRPAILMCFIPACAEILGAIILAPLLLGVTTLEAAIIGSVCSSDLIVPRMIKLIDEGYGRERHIPQLLLAGASVDDVFVIVVFTAITSLASTGTASAGSFLQIPISILTGILTGAFTGTILAIFFKKFHIRDSVKILILLSFSFLLLELQRRLEEIIPISGLLAIMSLGIALKQRYSKLAERLSIKYNKLWIAAEIFLFVLVGATVDLRYAAAAGIFAVLFVVGTLIFRMSGVAISLFKTGLTKHEKWFCMIAYTPKATVQAAIGAIPLTMGLRCGQTVLAVAVLSILITAPFGAICIDNLHKRFLSTQE